MLRRGTGGSLLIPDARTALHESPAALLVCCIAASGLIALVVVLPFVEYVLGAAVLAYLLVIDDAGNGLLLAAYCVLVVSSIDNFVRPIVINRRANPTPGLILLGVFGGVYLLGFVGLFVGPVVFGVLAATIKTHVEGYEQSVDAPEPAGAASGTAEPSSASISEFSESDSTFETTPDDAGFGDAAELTDRSGPLRRPARDPLPTPGPRRRRGPAANR